jgi:ubiquinone/menaquinone biosynthesis C-methylase UbiE
MQWTGERMVAEINIGKGAIEHLHRYGIITNFIKNKVVLDLASGEGYGSNLIAEHAAFVTGVDISTEAVKHATQKYKRENLCFLEGSATKVPLEDYSVDVIVSFETLEHHDKHDEMMIEFKRVLKADGVLFISTPEKENYKKIDPFNPYHIKELTFQEFDQLLGKHFSKISMYHQRFFDASFIYPHDRPVSSFDEYTGDFSKINKDSFDANYYFNLAICSNNNSFDANMTASFFNGTSYLKKKQEEMCNAFELRIAEAREAVRQSNSYRLGNFLLLPFSAIKRWIS